MRSRLFWALALASSALTHMPAHAQVAPSSDGQAAPAGAGQAAPAQVGPQTSDSATQGDGSTPPRDIVVTGSNIIRNGYQAPTPVTAVTAETLQLNTPGRLGDALINLPQFRGSPSPRSTSQATIAIGGSLLSLRNLGAFRTLVLLDGRRLVPNTTRGEYDSDVLPQGLVQRVDIVTGGASAQYGSDAVGGVVNFVLDENYTGIKGTLQKGISTYGDGPTTRIEVNAGHKFADDRGHLLLSYVHSEYGAIQSVFDRPFGNHNNNLVLTGGTPSSRFFDNVALPASYGGAITAGPLAGTQFLPGGVSAPYTLGSPRNASAAVNSDGVSNQQPVSTGLNSNVYFGHLSFAVSDAFKPFVEGSYAVNHVYFNQGYPQYQFGSTAFTIYSGNPYLPANIQAQMTAQGIASFALNRVDRDLGMTYVDVRSDTLNTSIGFDGKGGAFSWGASGGFGRSVSHNLIGNNLDLTRFYAAADAVRGPGGTIVCNVTLTNPGLYPGCQPINLLGDGSATLNPAAVSYIRHDESYRSRITQYLAHAFVRGEPFSTWAGPVGIAITGDYRRQELLQTVDPLATTQIFGTGVRGFPTTIAGRTGGFATLNIGTANGGVNVWEGAGEVLVPLAKDMRFARSLDLNAAVRYTNYSTSGGVVTWKAGLTWAPISDIRFRGTYSRDIRAPNLGELYLAGSSAQVPIVDNRAGRGTYFIFSYGVPNPTLKPERGKTYSVGAVFTPTFLPGFSASVDYYNIEITDVISTLTPQQTINACASGSTFNCANITYDPGTGNIARIYLPGQNLASLKTNGIDFDVSYAHALGNGRFTARSIATYSPDYITQAPGATPVNYGGEVGGRLVGTSTLTAPKFTGTLDLAWENDQLGLSAQERLIGEGTYDVTYVQGTTIDNNHVPAIAYTDVTVRAKIGAYGGKQEVFLTINNLFNKYPPIRGIGSVILPSQYNRALYDGIGRFFTAGVRFAF